MVLKTMRDALNRAMEKRELSSSKTLELIDRIAKVIEEALKDMRQTDGDMIAYSVPRFVILKLKSELDDISVVKLFEESEKDLEVALDEYAKFLDEQFDLDISLVPRKVDWDIRTINSIIAGHFYRQGLFDIGDCFVAEAQVSDMMTVRTLSTEIHQILGAMRSGDLQPALDWASAQREHLLQSGSKLAFMLHSLQYMETLLSKGSKEALAYAGAHLFQFHSTWKTEVQKLTACVLWKDRPDLCPDAELMCLTTRRKRMEEELTRQLCRNLLHQSCKSPLCVVTEAGTQALPAMVRMAGDTSKESWQQMEELPDTIELGDEFCYHSIFMCPVHYEEHSVNPPLILLPCRHVVCNEAVDTLSENGTTDFRCPNCRLTATAGQCRQLFI